jgi:hypothetical protein
MSNENDSGPSGPPPFEDPAFALLRLPEVRSALRLPDVEPTQPRHDWQAVGAAATLTAGYWAACAADSSSCPHFGPEDYLATFRRFLGDVEEMQRWKV